MVVKLIQGERQVSASPQETSLDSLTEREFDVLSLISSGWSNQSIADRLAISLGSVEASIRRLYSKLEVTGDKNINQRVKAALMYREQFYHEYFKQTLDIKFKPREYETLSLVAQGLSNSAIAEEMFFSPYSVGHPINKAYQKLGIDVKNPDYNPRVMAMLMFDRVPVPKGYNPTKA